MTCLRTALVTSVAALTLGGLTTGTALAQAPPTEADVNGLVAKIGAVVCVENIASVEADAKATADINGILASLPGTATTPQKDKVAAAAAARLTVLDGCKTSKAPETSTTPTPTSTPTMPTAEPPFLNCDAAREAGKAPIIKGQDGYNASLDTDGDGIACEDREGVDPGSGTSNDQVSVIPNGGVDTGDGSTL